MTNFCSDVSISGKSNYLRYLNWAISVICF